MFTNITGKQETVLQTVQYNNLNFGFNSCGFIIHYTVQITEQHNADCQALESLINSLKGLFT